MTDRLKRARTDYLRKRPRLIRQRDDGRYGEIVHRHLASGEAGFFVNQKRFYLFADLIERHVRIEGAKILNVASGPFALEYYVDLDAAEITSFDRSEALVGVYGELRDAGLIGDCRFFVGDAARRAITGRFDLVIINDVFYSKEVDYFSVIEEFAGQVASGGHLYFDIPDQKAEFLWAMAGKNRNHARYDLDPVARHLERLGFTILAAAPSMGIKGGLDEALRRVLWSSAGIANNSAIIARAD